MTTGSLLYVYGIVRGGFDAARAPAGMDDAPVIVAGEGGIAALASHLPESGYAAHIIGERSGDVQWLSPRAMSHDRVLTWAHDHGGVIPLPMFSMWGSDEALAASLRERSPEVTRLFERVSNADEFGLRVHRRDAAMLETLHETDAELGELHRAARAASPGQRYLLERKLAEQGKAALRAAGQRMAQEVFDALRPIARDAVARPLTPVAGAASDATLILNGAFLVDRARLDAFRAAVATQIEKLESRGLAFDFTGPWPPYNFAK